MRLGELRGYLRMPVAPQKEASMQVADGLGETILPVAHPKLTLVVRAPDVIRALGDALRTSWVRPPMPAPLSYQTPLRQNMRRGGHRRKLPPAVPPLHNIQQLLRSPVRMLLSHLHQFLGNEVRCLPRTTVRASREVLQTAASELLVAIDPLVGGLSGNTVHLRQLSHAVVLQRAVAEEVCSLFAHGNPFPRHGHHLLLREECYPCPQNKCYLCLQKTL